MDSILTKREMDIYAAGLFDGEGCVTLSRHKSKNRFRYPKVDISSTTEEILLFMKETYGGNVVSKKVYKKHHKPSWVWSGGNIPNTMEFLKCIIPFLKEPEKKRRAMLIVNIYPSVTPRNGRYDGKQLIAKYAFEEEFFRNTSNPNFKL